MSDAPARIGFTRLTARADGVVGTCKVCGRDTHFGARIEARRETTDRTVDLFVCYDCVEACHLIAVGRMPCDACNGKGHKGP